MLLNDIHMNTNTKIVVLEADNDFFYSPLVWDENGLKYEKSYLDDRKSEELMYEDIAYNIVTKTYTEKTKNMEVTIKYPVVINMVNKDLEKKMNNRIVERMGIHEEPIEIDDETFKEMIQGDYEITVKTKNKLSIYISIMKLKTLIFIFFCALLINSLNAQEIIHRYKISISKDLSTLYVTAFFGNIDFHYLYAGSNSAADYTENMTLTKNGRSKKYDPDDIETYRQEIEERARDDNSLEPDEEIEDQQFEQATQEILDEQGSEPEQPTFDGIIIKNMIDDIGDASNKIADQFIVFDSTQVKSVKNKGTFSPYEENILRQPSDAKETRGYYDPSNSVIRLT